MRWGKNATGRAIGAMGLVAGVLVTLYACSPFDGGTAEPGVDGGGGLDGTTTDALASSSSSSSGGDAALVDPPDPPDDDASVITPSSDAGVDASCPLVPTTTHVEVVNTAVGIVCDAPGAIDAGGPVTGLDYANGGLGYVGTHSVTSCVGIEFNRELRDVTLNLASSPKACGNACTTGCNTDDYASVFLTEYGQPTVSWYFVGHLEPLTAVFQNFVVTVPQNVVASYVVICRGGGGASHDDVLVDGVTGHCR